MLRSFLPVGQGAFYLEQFNEKKGKRINVVYDCGSSTSKELVESEVKSNLSKGEDILFVFISHLDVDHINGLEFLLKYCNVKNLILPLTDRQERYLLSLKYLCDSDENYLDDFLFQFIRNPYETVFGISDNTRIFAIRDYENYEQEEAYYEVQRNADHVMIVHSGTNILNSVYVKEDILSEYWEYIPFNFKFKERSLQFREALTNNLPKDVTIENIIDLWGYKSIQNAIKKAYNGIDGNLNVNSMTLFSGVRNSTIYQTFVLPFNLFKCRLKYHHCFKQCAFEILKPNGCLYTGDFDAYSHWDKMYEAYKHYWEYIGCIQIPHHGSRYSYNHQFTLLNSFFVISAGKNNRYRHPSGSVVKDLIFTKNYPFIVNEDRDREVIMEVNLLF